ncbi:MAG: WD40 repeat domain-containing protein [Planctomycetales bacterium]|nr:WD40 repeat domain-containing protein [Planctomycetales bacterium]
MEKFDAYYKWLGIPPEEQPPNHYRLLGVSQFEADPDVISSAANQRVGYLRQRAAGPHQELTKKLLDEVAAARNCLLDAKKKSAYDLRLKAGPAAEPLTGTLVAKPASISSSELDAIAAEPRASAMESIQRIRGSKAGLVVVGAVVIAIIAGSVYLLRDGSGTVADPNPPPTDQNDVTSSDGSNGDAVMTDTTSTDNSSVSPDTTPSDATTSPPKEVADGKSKPTEPDKDTQPRAPVASVDPREVLTLQGHKVPVVELATTADGRFIVSASQGRDRQTGQSVGECIVWDVAAGQSVVRYTGHPGLVRSVAVSPDGKYVLSSGDDIRLWELETGRDVREFKTSRRPANRVAFSPDGRAATVGAATLIVWDVETGEATRQIAGLSVFSLAVGFSLDGKVVAAGTGEKGDVIGLWDPESGAELCQLAGHQATVRGLAFLPDGRHLWSCDAANLAFLWDLKEKKNLKKIGPASSIRATPDGGLVLIGTSTGAVRFHDAVTSRFRIGFPQLPCQIRDIALLPDSQRIVFAGTGTGPGEPEEADFAIYIWTLPPSIKVSPASESPTPVAIAAAPSSESTRPPSAAERVSKRLPPPGADEFKQAQQQVRDIFKDDFALAKKPEQKGALATKLFKQADTTRDDPAGRYALLMEARELAMTALNGDGALELADRLAELYEIDPIPLKLDSLKQISASTKSTLSLQVATENCFELADEAVRKGNFEAATELMRLATSMAIKSKLGKLRDDTKVRSDILTQKRKLHDESEQAKKTLEDSPDDAAAREKLGRFLCFVLDDWETGLPHLAKAVTPALRSAAELELAASSNADNSSEVADAWYDFAKTAKLPDKPFAQARSLKWYRSVIKDATGLARVRAQTRIQELSKLVPDTTTSNSPRKSSGS